MKDYKVIGVNADCTRGKFVSLLANSPAAAAASMVYDECIVRRVSPLFIAAMFWVESKFGTEGWATKTRSWGNTRPKSYGINHIGVYDQDNGSFYPAHVTPPANRRYLSAYGSWNSGGISTVARLVLNPAYAGVDSVREIIYIWAPPTDSNNTEEYIHSVLTFIEANLTVLPGVIKSTGNVVLGSIDFGGNVRWIQEITIKAINNDGAVYERTWRLDGLHPWAILFGVT